MCQRERCRRQRRRSSAGRAIESVMRGGGRLISVQNGEGVVQGGNEIIIGEVQKDSISACVTSIGTYRTTRSRLLEKGWLNRP